MNKSPGNSAITVKKWHPIRTVYLVNDEHGNTIYSGYTTELETLNMRSDEIQADGILNAIKTEVIEQ